MQIITFSALQMTCGVINFYIKYKRCVVLFPICAVTSTLIGLGLYERLKMQLEKSRIPI